MSYVRTTGTNLSTTNVNLMMSRSEREMLQSFDHLLESLERNGDSLQPTLPLIFDQVSSKFDGNGDKNGSSVALQQGRQSVPERAFEVIVALMDHFGLASGFEILNDLIKRKNIKDKQKILRLLTRLCEYYKEDIMWVPDIVSQIAQASLLNETDSTVHQVAIECLWKLSSIFGSDAVLVRLLLFVLLPHLTTRQIY